MYVSGFTSALVGSFIGFLGVLRCRFLSEPHFTLLDINNISSVGTILHTVVYTDPYWVPYTVFPSTWAEICRYACPLYLGSMWLQILNMVVCMSPPTPHVDQKSPSILCIQLLCRPTPIEANVHLFIWSPYHVGWETMTTIILHIVLPRGGTCIYQTLMTCPVDMP